MLELGLSNCDLVAGALAESDRELAAYASELVDQACSPKHVSVYLRELKIASVERQRVLKAQLICDRGRSGDTEGVLAAIVELNTIRDYQPPGEEVQFMCARKLLSKSVTPREFLVDPRVDHERDGPNIFLARYGKNFLRAFDCPRDFRGRILPRMESTKGAPRAFH